nr:formin-J-like [Leptinotarsa decemlineata]
MEGDNVVRTDRFRRIQGACLQIGDKIYPVYKGTNTVGRNKVATINVKHLNVSQNQAIIILVDDQQHFISDLNSSNGTFLHDAELVPFKLYELATDTKITFGDVVGTYKKISKLNNTLNLMETAEMTQDITQNFYAANTQLIFDHTVADQITEHSHIHSLQNGHSADPENIHEMDTQVIEYPLTNIQRNEPTCNSPLIVTENLNKCVIKEPVDNFIHEAPTQILDYSDLKISNQSPLKKKSETISREDAEDIQVITGFKAIEMNSSEEVSRIKMRESPNDIKNIEISQKSGTDEITQILNEDETQKAIELINTSLLKDSEDKKQKNISSGSFSSKTSPESNSGVTTQVLNENEMQKTIELFNPTLQKLDKDKKNEREVFHSSQTPCTSGMNRNTTFQNDESFMSFRKQINVNEEIEDTFIEESVSNDSVDFLTMQVHDRTEENTEDSQPEKKSTTSVKRQVTTNVGSVKDIMVDKFSCDGPESDIFHRSKTPTPKLPSEQEEKSINSDSETDIEDSESKTKKLGPKQLNFDDSNVKLKCPKKMTSERKKLKKTISENPDSDTDIEDIQEIGFKKKPLRKLNSDEDLTQSKLAGYMSGSDTDCEKEIKDKHSRNHVDLENKKQDKDSGSDTDIEVEKHSGVTQMNDGDLNETDCIPATQDAFAEAFDYKAQRTENSCNQSSEESFKLGITELLNESSENKAYVEVNTENKIDDIVDNQNSHGRQTDEISTNIEEHYNADQENNDSILDNSSEMEKEQKNDNIYILPTQKFRGDDSKPNLTDGDHRSLQTDEEIPTVSKDNDDVYMLATQKMDTEKDVFTDFKAPSKMFTFKKKGANLEDSLTTILSDNKNEVDIYMMATQNINESSSVEKNDDVYLQATQQLEARETKEYDVFSQPTQCLNDNRHKPGSQSRENEEDEDIYMAATQQMESRLIRKSNIKSMTPLLKDQEDVYMQDTQKIQEETAQDIIKNSNSIPCVATDSMSTSTCVYNSETQANETQSEIPFADDNVQVVVTQCSSRPQNPLLHILNDEAMSEEVKKSSGSSTKRSRVIQESIPESPIKKVKSIHVESLLEKITSDSRKNDVETLSQIENFVKQPLEIVPKLPKRKELIAVEETAVQKDNLETLSHIEAFVQKPLEELKYRKSIRTEKKSVAEERSEISETLSQIDAFVKKPFESVQEEKKQEPSRHEIRKSTRRKSQTESSTSSVNEKEEIKDENRLSRRMSKRRHSNNKCETKATAENDKLDVIKEYNEADDFEDTCERLSRTKSRTKGKERLQLGVNDNENLEKNHSSEDSRSHEVKSDVDQSFALLESKCSKVKRQPRKDPVLNEIKVSITSHRRSMSTAESSKKSTVELFPLKKSRRTTVNNNTVPNTSGMTKRKAETITKSRKENDVDSDSDSEILSKKSRKSSKINKRTIDQNTTNNEASLINQKPSSSKQISRSDKNIKILSTSEESDVNKIYNDSKKHHTVTSDENDTINSSATPLKSKRGGKSISNETLETPRRGQRSVANETLLSSAERLKRKLKPKVVFTMLESPQLESFIKHLGGSIVDTVDSSTVLVTEHVKRSQKLLTAVAQGKPICSPKWIHASKKMNEFLDPWDYILVDIEAEIKWQFSLKESLTRAANNKLLANYTFQLMVTNAADVLKGAIEASGGKCVSRNPGKNCGENKFIIVASPEHKSKYAKMKKQNQNITIVEPEAIFDGVLRQELRFSRHLLS